MSLYRAIRFNGAGTLTFDSISWEGSGAANQSHNGYNATLSNTWVPAVSGDKKTFFDNCVYRDGFVHTTTSVPAGDYEVYIYVSEDDASNTYGVNVNGTLYEGLIMAPAPNYWERRGPYPVTLSSTGSITLTLTGANYIVLSGIEIHAVNHGSGGAKMLHSHRTNITANSTTYVDTAVIPAASFIAGHTYLIIGSAMISVASAANDLRARLVRGTTPTAFDDATLDYETESNTGSSRQSTPMQWLTVYTQPGTAEQIKIQISNISTSVVTAELVQLTAIDLDGLVLNTDYWYNEDLVDYNTSTTPTAKASVTFTPNGTDTFLYLGDMAIPPISTTSNYIGELYDSVAGQLAQVDSEGEDISNELRRHMLASVQVPTAVSHTVSVRVSHEVSIHSLKSTRVFVLRLNAFDQFAVQLNASGTAVADAPSWTTLAQVTPTPNADTDWFILGYYDNDLATVLNAAYTRMQVELDDIPTIINNRPTYGEKSPDKDGWDNTDQIPVVMQTVAPLTTGNARTLSYEGSRVLSSGSPVAKNRMIVAFSSVLSSGSSSQTAYPDIVGAPALYNPTLSGGNANVSPPLVGGPTLYGHTLVGGNGTVTAPLIASGETLYTHVVNISAPGNQSILLDTLLGAPALYVPIVAGPLLVPLLTTGEVLYNPTLMGTNPTVIVPLLPTGEALYGPTLSGIATVSPPLIGSPSALYTPQVVAGVGVVQTPQIASLEALYTPSLSNTGAVTISLVGVAGGPTLFVPGVLGGTSLLKPKKAGLIRVGIDVDGDRFVDWEGRDNLNLIPAAVWFTYLQHGEVGTVTATDRKEKTVYGLVIRHVAGAALDVTSYTRLGTNVQPAAPVVASSIYTVVVWVKSLTANVPAKIVLFDQDGIQVADGPEQMVGSKWTKFRYVYSTPASGVTALQVGIARSTTTLEAYEWDITGYGVYLGVSNIDYNSGRMINRPYPDVMSEDISRWVLSVRFDSGVNEDPAALTPIDGECTILLDNTDQIWSPRNGTSPFSGNLNSLSIIEVQIDELGTGQWRQLWTGFFRSISIDTGTAKRRQATITGTQGLVNLDDLDVTYAPKALQTATDILRDVVLTATIPADRFSWKLGVSQLGINTGFPDPDAISNFDESTYEYPVAGVGLTASASVRDFFNELVINEGGFAFYDRYGRPSFRTRGALAPDAYAEEDE